MYNIINKMVYIKEIKSIINVQTQGVLSTKFTIKIATII